MRRIEKMLAYVLAIAVALGSFAFYMAAFFFPEVHRKNDFYWCFLGLFYALVLWIASNRITGSVLVAQTASVVLLGWMAWQTVSLRKATSPAAVQTEVSPDVEQKARTFGLSNIFGLFRRKKAETPEPEAETETPTETETPDQTAPSSSEEAIKAIEDSEAIPAQPEVDITSSESSEADTTETPAEETETTEQPISPEPPSPDLVEAAQSDTEAGTVDNVEEAVVEAANPQIDSPEVDEDTPVEKVAPEAELTPPAETSPEQTPGTNREASEFPEKIEPAQPSE